MLRQSKPDFLKLFAVNDFLKPDDDANEQVWIEPQSKKKTETESFQQNSRSNANAVILEKQNLRLECEIKEQMQRKNWPNSRWRKNRRHSYGTDHISISYQ
jgi:hypothetical protein